MKTVKKYYCDVCGGVINQPDEGVLLWNCDFNDNGHEKYMRDFQIVHKRFTGHPCDDRSRSCSHGRLPQTREEALQFWLEHLDPKFNTSKNNRIGNRTTIDLSVFEGMVRTLIYEYDDARFYINDYADEVLGERDGFGVELTQEEMRKILKWAKKAGLR